MIVRTGVERASKPTTIDQRFLVRNFFSGVVEDMSFKISKIIVSKGRTVADEKSGKWERQHYSVEIEISDEKSIQEAKAEGGALIDGSLNDSTVAPRPASTKGSTELPFKAEYIPWKSKTGDKEPFELSDSFENPDHQQLLSFLKDHVGNAITSQGFYYWVFNSDGKTIGRKPVKQIQRRK